MPPKKQKNAGVFVVDVGEFSSHKTASGKPFISETLRCLKLIVEQKIFMDVKDDYGLVLMGTSQTDNPLAKQYKGQYRNIWLTRELDLADWELLRIIETQVKTTEEHADWLDSVIVAMDHLHTAEEETDYASKQIVLFTNFESPSLLDQQTFKGLVTKIGEHQIDLVVIGTNLASVNLGETDDDDEKALPVDKNKKFAAYLLDEVQGQSYTFEEALPQLMHFRRERTRHVPWNSLLEIGPNIKIAIGGYIKVKKADEVHWKEDMIAENEGQFEKERTYQRQKDPTVTVTRPDVIYGYRYGTTVVPLNSADEEEMHHNVGDRCLKMLKFTRAENIPMHLYSGNSTLYVFPRKTSGVVDQQAQIALSALIRALDETGNVVIVRRVYNRNTRARIGVLSPKISTNYECLVFHELPFADDVRHFEFPPIFTKYLQPKKEQLDAMDELIDSMDLTTAEMDEDGNTYEGLRPKAVINPHTIYLYEALAHRALHPKDPLPDPDPQVGAILETPSVLAEKADAILAKIQDLFPLEVADKKRVEKAQFLANKRLLTAEETSALDEFKRARLEGDGPLDLAAILGAQVTRIGTATPIQDFNILQPKLSFDELARQMQDVVLQLLVDSGGSNPALVTKCRDCLELLRAESVKRDPSNYNNWLRTLKETVMRNNFVGFWSSVIGDHLGLITREETADSTVDQEEARRFLEIGKAQEPDQNEAADEELLELL